MSVLSRDLWSIAAARRLAAAGAGALILLLSVLTSSPELHHLFHGHDDSGADDGCAVVLFAGGVSIAADTAVVAAEPMVWQLARRAAPTEILLTSPSFLLPQGRGPPAA